MAHYGKVLGGIVFSGDQPFDTGPVIPLDEDERKVGGECIDDHHPSGPRRIPQKEKKGGGDEEPMRPLCTAGFKDKLIQIIRVCGKQLFFLKTNAKNRISIRKAIFPTFHPQQPLPSFPSFFPSPDSGKE
ncbi:hypothetical protein ABID49_000266 [Bhargavaea ullalensis]|uniref:Uncharacterized protein n=1 Tax=Bhargavaea ullalensis TaxID=1265685 RepID=A0ABV2G7X0_9BACL